MQRLAYRHKTLFYRMFNSIINKAAAVAFCLICCTLTYASVISADTKPHAEDMLTQAGKPCYEGQKKLKAVERLIEGKDAEIGVAWMEGNALHSVNNEKPYPLMSVFKLHVAVALLRDMQQRGTSPDTTVSVRQEQMMKDTYSPMLKAYPAGGFDITVRRLLQYSVAESDNNAADILTDMAGGIDSVNRKIHEAGIRNCHLSETEASMHDAPINSYANWSTPESVVLLLRKLYDGKLLTGEYAKCLKEIMASTVTGPDKIKAGLSPGMTLAHKTGTGFRQPDGTKTADNDAGVVTTPDGRQVTIAILIKDSRMSDADNASLMAEITRIIMGDVRE